MSEEILDKLNQMDVKLDELLTWKAVHKEEHKGINRDVSEIRETLFENPGLKAQVHIGDEVDRRHVGAKVTCPWEADKGTGQRF